MMLPSLAMAAYSTTYSGIQKAPGFRSCRIAAAGSSRLFLILQFKLLIPLLMGSPNQARAGASPLPNPSADGSSSTSSPRPGPRSKNLGKQYACRAFAQQEEMRHFRQQRKVGPADANDYNFTTMSRSAEPLAVSDLRDGMADLPPGVRVSGGQQRAAHERTAVVSGPTCTHTCLPQQSAFVVHGWSKDEHADAPRARTRAGRTASFMAVGGSTSDRGRGFYGRTGCARSCFRGDLVPADGEDVFDCLKQR